MKIKYLKLKNWLLVSLGGLLGISMTGCEETPLACEYGCPEGYYRVRGQVTNTKGELVWSTSTSTFPCTWNLTDNLGQRVAPGLYKIHGNYENNEGYGGSNIINFVVLNPLQ